MTYTMQKLLKLIFFRILACFTFSDLTCKIVSAFVALLVQVLACVLSRVTTVSKQRDLI